MTINLVKSVVIRFFLKNIYTFEASVCLDSFLYNLCA